MSLAVLGLMVLLESRGLARLVGTVVAVVAVQVEAAAKMLRDEQTAWTKLIYKQVSARPQQCIMIMTYWALSPARSRLLSLAFFPLAMACSASISWRMRLFRMILYVLSFS